MRYWEWHEWVLASIVAGSLGLLGYAVYKDYNSPILATLHKRSWTCTKYHTETNMIMAGKVWVPVINTVCDQYSRK